MIERVATGPQKDQLDRNAGTAITPKTLVDGGNAAVPSQYRDKISAPIG